MNRPQVAASAPGKVLLAGGYLVLDRAYTGLVFGLDARIHVHVQKLSVPTDATYPEIIVRSPQFKDAEWRYVYQETEKQGGICITQSESHSRPAQSRNKFVETALAYTLSYVTAITNLKLGSIHITVLADTDYYSHPDSCEGTDSPRFLNFDVPLTEAHKTGLGSSAALVTAFSAAVLTYCVAQGQVMLDSDSGRRQLHNLAQAAHCAAQGKVGSGFDVAAAVYGSCIYRRFSPSVLGGLGEVGSPGFSGRLRAVVQDLDPSNQWDMQINQSAAVIPQGLKLLLCDVDCGSETVGLVRKVLTWRNDRPKEATSLWTSLQSRNEDLAIELQRLAQDDEVNQGTYQYLSDIILGIRCLVREMSLKADVPIEPDVQTQLLDACCRIEGVVGGMVPGAGGFDAVALLVEDKALVPLQDFLRTYTTSQDSENGPIISKARLLGVKQATGGLNIEEPEMYKDWAQ
ncbi:MAG: hypothetical protein Q9219_002792 [cf. Caloplaca sp. 3 TL-2023]